MSNLILILDDELAYAEMLSSLLEEHGYATDICTEPRLAIERLHENSYGLIISDFKMPECDGAEFIIQLRKVLPQVPVIVISGLMGKPDLLKIANIGVELVLEKPFNVPVFLDFISKFVQRRESGTSPSKAAISDRIPRALDSEVAFDYPTPVKFLADQSDLAKYFLSQLWLRVQSSLHSLLVVPPGGEVNLVAQEVAQWLGYSETKPQHFSYGQLQSAETRHRIENLASKGKGRVIVLTVPKGMEIDRGELDAFFEWSLKQSLLLEKLRFIHAMPDVVAVRQLNISKSHKDSIREVLPLPPLSVRLVDLSVYSKSILGSLPVGRAKELTPEAVSLLMQHRWARNYAELHGSLYRASVYSGRGLITEAALAMAMKEQHGSAPEKTANLNLETYLHDEQNRFLRQQLADGHSVEDLREIVGSRAERIQLDHPPLEQPFLFKDLI